MVVGWRRSLGFGVPRLQWPPDLEEGARGSGGPTVVAGWPAKGEEKAGAAAGGEGEEKVGVAVVGCERAAQRRRSEPASQIMDQSQKPSTLLESRT